MLIPEDKIVVVTGDPRSGTSLMMLVLKALGIPISGSQWPALVKRDGMAIGDKDLPEKLGELISKAKELGVTFKDDEEAYSKFYVKKQVKSALLSLIIEAVTNGTTIPEFVDEETLGTIEKIRTLYEQQQTMNPDGLWEIPGTVVIGLQDIDVYGGTAIKIISPGMPPSIRRGRKVGTNTDLVHKGIICTRDPRWVAQSQTRLSRNVKMVQKDGTLGVRDMLLPNANRYAQENGEFIAWLTSQSEEFVQRFIPIDHDDMIDHTKDCVDQIIKHLELTPTEDQIQSAIDCVRVDGKRSPAEFKDWMPETKFMGEAAQQVYIACKSLDKADASAALLKVAEAVEANAIELSKWYDCTTGLLMNPLIARIVKSPEEVAARNRMFVRELKNGMHPMTSPLYKETDQPYVIQRPIDLGDLNSTLVIYDEVTMTREQAYNTHQTRWMRGEAMIDIQLVVNEIAKVS